MARSLPFLTFMFAFAGACQFAGAGDGPDTTPADTSSFYSKMERSHWSFRRPKRPPVPQVSGAALIRRVATPVDTFIFARLQQAELTPAPPANRTTLIRRLYFDLFGLPPSPAAIDAFLADRSPAAYARLVDRLLADPRYGERWAQHWLDVVRFAESEGFEYDRHRPSAWRYRDYVIRSLNDDKPYRRFVTEQIAGDEMAFSSRGERMSPAERDAKIAVGFHRLGPVRRNAGNADVAFSRNEVLTEMTDAVGSSFLGLTVGCARCHDHMFDPFRQKDYYRLQAFLAASQPHDVPLVGPGEWADWKRRNAEINKHIAETKKQLANAKGNRERELRRKLQRLKSKAADKPPSVFSVRNDFGKRTPIHLLKRGDEFQKREQVGMRVPGVFLPDRSQSLPPTTRQPKTRLARWITRDDNPLTARVMVNRIWQYHFGIGLVETSNDFGLNGTSPSHPRLLDWLACEFSENGGSVKAIHRLILLSSTYRQSAAHASPIRGRKVDPRNRLLWSFPRRRLDAEQIRDAMLAVSGLLYSKATGPSVMVPVDPELVALLYKPEQWQIAQDSREHRRRSIYLLAKRNLRLPFLEVFDQPSLQTSCFRRVTSTHAPQSLELLNGRFSNHAARAFADRLRRECGHNVNRQIERGLRLATGRAPSSRERTLARRFLQKQPLHEFTLALFNLNSFLYVD